MSAEPHITDIVVIDMSFGSYEISALVDNQLVILDGKFDLREHLQHFPPGPVSLGDAFETAMIVESELPAAPPWFKADKEFLAIGGDVFATALKAKQPATFTKNQIWDLMFDSVRHEAPHNTVISLALIYAIMDHFGIDRLTYLPPN